MARRRRSQPYRLDWQGIAQNNEQLNRRLQKLWSDADEMFQILFDDLLAADNAIIDAPTAVVSSSTSLYPFGGPPGAPGMDGEPGEILVMGSNFSSSSGTVTMEQIRDAGYWSPLTNGDVANPELIFAAGDVIMVWTPTP